MGQSYDKTVAKRTIMAEKHPELVAIEIGKDFMLSHSYIKNDFDVHKWATPEFLEQAARELLEEEWKKRTTSKLPKAAAPLASGSRLG